MSDDIRRVVVRLSAEGGASAGQQVEQFTRKATEGLQATGRAARAARNELAQAQVQLTDIVVSLASGQSPVTVLLQQGGQLRDVFGSVGGAVGAVGRAVASMVTPFTVAGGAVAALVAGYIGGTQQSAAFRDAILASGNAAGVTEGQFNSLIRRVTDAGNVSVGAGRDIALALVNSGTVGAKALESTAEAVANVSRVTGKTATEVADDFARMSGGVVKWAAEHNKAWNFIDSAQMRYIIQLEKQGKAEEAMIEVNKALNKQFAATRQQLGYLETSWKGVGNFASWAWDKMMGLGRNDTLQDQIKDIEAKLNERMTRGPLSGGTNDKINESWKKGNEELRKQLENLRAREGLERAGAAARAEIAAREAKAVKDLADASGKKGGGGGDPEAAYQRMVRETLANRAPRLADIEAAGYEAANRAANENMAATAREAAKREEQEAKEQQRRQDRAADYARNILDQTEQLNVDLIESDAARAAAQLELDRARMRAELDAIGAYGEERAAVEEAIEKNIAARKLVIQKQAAIDARTELDKTLEGAAKDIWTKLSTGETIKGSDILKQITGAIAQDSWKNSIRPLLTGDKPGAEGGDFFAKMLDKLGGSADKTATGFDSVIAKMSGFENGLGGIAQALWQMIAGSGGNSGGGILNSIGRLFSGGSGGGTEAINGFFAKGGAFTNGVFNQTTPFAFKAGGSFRMGIMGEAGDEAVMPLARDGAGRLGVRAQGGGGARQVSYVTNLTQVFAPGVTQADMAMHGQALANQMRAETINSAVRPGGALWRAARGY